MRIFKNKTFTRWAAKEGLNDEVLIQAVDEIEQGLVDASLGGNVYKKRVALPGRGKSGGVRTVLAYQTGETVFLSMVLPKMCARISMRMSLKR